MRVYLPDVAERYGVSAQSAGDHLRTLADYRVIEYHVDRKTGADGLPRSQVSIARGPLLSAPQDIHPEVPRKGWGGKRAGAGRKCKSCQSENLVIQRRIVCRDCGAVEAMADVEVNTSPAPATEDDTSPAQEPCPASHLDFGEDFGEVGPDDGPPDMPDTEMQEQEHTPSTFPTPDMRGSQLDSADAYHRPPADVQDADRGDRCVDGHAHRWIIDVCLACHAKKAG